MYKWMKGSLCMALCLSLGAGSQALAAQADAGEEGVTLKGTYQAHITGYDWGCGVDKVIVSFDQALDSADAGMFSVKETKETINYSEPGRPSVTVENARTVTAAYLCDESGTPVSGASSHAALELTVGPKEGSPIVWSPVTQFNTWCNPYTLTITLQDGAELTSGGRAVSGLSVDETMAGRVTGADAFSVQEFTAADGTSYKSAFYEPSRKSDTLVVWLHGLGEGGTVNTDPYVTVLANKVTALIGSGFQDLLGGAYVLAPQCPTYWMDADGKSGNLNGGSITADGTSYYQESLHELIAACKEQTGAKKVVIAGCSNGGYMTMLMAVQYRDEYDAYVPICEAYPDTLLSDEQLAGIKDLPLYFIYSKNDTTVDPSAHEVPTISRLKAMGASNLHVATTETVEDTSGNYKAEDGTPYQYAGHWSWIYFDNNESKCDDCGVNVWQWIASQVL